ncbi:RagB/SusD family nutrient uptake outer membrane protein [Chitinophaga sp. CF418]|uniref:RagB/SusD family nutrient uptake outer membrane protein n=1 Tax=Chitinophaga sp. CF418 TaxID=1855287 RepID=UPI0009209D43|nr:RagB/SusD family nutrient uptake outer membrane protein [Chitinophaga sp. CF418]SHN45536.1 Starch-binding associating with outer membrane [Chitinophaga sp. CF418]
MKKIYYSSSRWLILIALCYSFQFTSCKKFIEVDPPVTSVTDGNVFLGDATAAAAITSIYAQMVNTRFALNMTVYPELAADNLKIFTTGFTDYTTYFTNSLQAGDGGIPIFWNSIYPYIYQVNAAIEGLTKTTTLTPSVKQNLLGEAYFLRGFFYHHIASLYGDAPLALTTNYGVNNKLSRSAVTAVYAQAVADLKMAQSLLGDSYLQKDANTPYGGDNPERVRPNKSACTAILARVYLYQRDWANAEAAATEVINKTSQYGILSLDQAFLKNSKETIWALQQVRANVNADEGDFFILRNGGPSSSRDQAVYLSPKFVEYFQTGDQRRLKWINSVTKAGLPYYYAFKYKVDAGVAAVSEYSIVLRLAELYLIRSEARIQQNKVTEGIADLNVLRERAINISEPDLNLRLKLLATSLSKVEALAALNYERRVELFCEWGHRWYDLRRSGQIDAVMQITTSEKGGVWQSYKALFPVPALEIQYNGALSQNDGYAK